MNMRCAGCKRTVGNGLGKLLLVVGIVFGAVGAQPLWAGGFPKDVKGFAMPKEGLFAVKPHLQLLGEDSAAVVWMTKRKALGYVEWSQDGGKAWNTAWTEEDGLRDAGTTVHRSVLTGFDPSKSVRLRVCSRENPAIYPYRAEFTGEVETLASELAPILPADGRVSFAMFNDVHGALKNYPQLLAQLDRPVNFIVFNGDISSDIDTEEQVQRNILAPLAYVCENTHAAMWYLRGNHETRGGFARRFRDYLSLPNGHFYGAVTLGAARFVFIDTGEDKEDGHEQYSGLTDFDHYLARQMDWLRAEFGSDAWRKAKFRIAVMHIPPTGVKSFDDATYRGEANRMRRDLTGLLKTANLSLVLAAHLHCAANDDPRPDRPYPVVVGGSNYTDFADKFGRYKIATLTRCDYDDRELVVSQVNCKGEKLFERRIVSGDAKPDKSDAAEQVSYCNPMDLDYRFTTIGSAGKTTSYREAADPEILPYNGAYYLFASRSGGYWKSSDLLRWKLIEPSGYCLGNYAPTVRAVDGCLTLTANSAMRFYRTTDVDAGKWAAIPEKFPWNMVDPMIFQDDDGRTYIYWGSGDKPPISVVEVDPRTMLPKGEPTVIFKHDAQRFGWERWGDDNEAPEHRLWVEGPFVSKRNGRYYLQYAAPGTQLRSYCDGMYVSDKPMGPFALQTANPFAYRSCGFAPGVGHGGVFADAYGNWWHVGTVRVSVRHIFERRLTLDPVFFSDAGEMLCYALWGDYPRTLPRRRLKGPEEVEPKWMLLSYGAKAFASTTKKGSSASFAFDEDNTSWWVPDQPRNSGEWIAADLGAEATIASVQVNFMDHNADMQGRDRGVDYRYVIEVSDDGASWRTVVDVSNGNGRDASSPYHELPKPVRARHVRVTNRRCDHTQFSVSGLRVFGLADGPVPDAPKNLSVVRDPKDPCRATVSWDAVAGAEGYAVRFGTDRKFLYLGKRVRGACQLDLTMLGADRAYFLEVVAFNGAGLSRPSEMKALARGE